MIGRAKERVLPEPGGPTTSIEVRSTSVSSANHWF
jgi:hypothetical protein